MSSCNYYLNHFDLGDSSKMSSMSFRGHKDHFFLTPTSNFPTAIIAILTPVYTIKSCENVKYPPHDYIYIYGSLCDHCS